MYSLLLLPDNQYEWIDVYFVLMGKMAKYRWYIPLPFQLDKYAFLFIAMNAGLIIYSDNFYSYICHLISPSFKLSNQLVIVGMWKVKKFNRGCFMAISKV